MKKKYFDLAIEILFLSLLFLAAIIFDRRIGIVFSLTKATTIRFFTILILSAWAIKILIFREHKWARTILDWPVLTYLLACTIATITSVHVYISFFGFYGRFEGLITLYNFGLVFFITTNYITDVKALKRLVATVFSAGTIMALYAIIQRKGIDPYAWGGVVTWQRVIATIGQPNFYAAYADMSFLLGFILFLMPKKEKEFNWQSILPALYFIASILIFILMIYNLGTGDVFLWYLSFAVCTFFAVFFAYKFNDLPPLALDLVIGIGMVLTYTALFYTQSRGGFLGFFAALSLFFIIGPRKLLVQNWQKIGILFLALAIITGITISDPQFSLFERMSGEITIEKAPQEKDTKIEFEGAAGSRGETWTSGFGIVADYPFFGIGPEVLKMIFPNYETELFRFKEAFHVKQDRMHNETLDVPVTRGLVSFFAYLILLFLVFRQGFTALKAVSEEKRLVISAFLAATAAYLIQNQFSFGVVAITSLFWIMWAVVVKAKDLPDEMPEEEKEKEKGLDDIPWLWTAIVIILTIAALYFSQFPFWADKEFKMGKTFAEARRFDQAGGFYDSALAIQPFEGGPITHKGITLINLAASRGPEERSKIYKETIDILDFGTKVDPYNADNFFILSKVYLMLNNIDKAQELADIALKIDPYYAEVYLIKAQIARVKGKMADYQKYYNKAYQINPTIPEAKERKIWSLIEGNNFSEAFKLAQEILMENPRYAGAYNAIGTIYLRQGERDKARQAFDTVLRLDPNNSYARQMAK